MFSWLGWIFEDAYQKKKSQHFLLESQTIRETQNDYKTVQHNHKEMQKDRKTANHTQWCKITTKRCKMTSETQNNYKRVWKKFTQWHKMTTKRHKTTTKQSSCFSLVSVITKSQCFKFISFSLTVKMWTLSLMLAPSFKPRPWFPPRYVHSPNNAAYLFWHLPLE